MFIWVRSPGHLLGVERAAGDQVPAAGALDLLIDGDAAGTVAIDFSGLAGQSLLDAGVGAQVAATIEQALHAAVDLNAFAVDGIPIADATRLAELRATTVRWHRRRSRLVLSSGRRGPVSDPEQTSGLASRFEINGGNPALIAVLGLDAGALVVDGRIYRHRVPNPTAIALDVRLDLWAGSQGELARVAEAWTRITPTRGQLLTQPGLLADDVAEGNLDIRLVDRGEARSRWSLALMEAGNGFSDRLTGGSPTLFGGAAVQPDALRIPGAGEALLTVYEAPPIPHPWQPDHPAPNGYALSIGLTAEPGAQDGDSLTLVRLRLGNRSALALAVNWTLVDGELHGDVIATAEHADGAAFGTATARVAAVALEQCLALHALIDARLGVLELFIDGLPATPVPGAPAIVVNPGTPAGGSDMQLVLGDAAAAGNPPTVRFDHLHLHGRPLGPLDPRARSSTASAGAWRIGDPIALVRTEDGFSSSGEAFRVIVTAVAGDQLTLDRPVRGDWPQASTIVYRDSLFFAQRQLKRRDDFMNRLYRLTAEYRVSAFIDERYPGVSSPLVESTEVQVRELDFALAEEADPAAPAYPTRPISAGPGVSAVISPNPDDHQP